MEEKLWILEDLNMMYIRQIALSLQVKESIMVALLIWMRSFLLLNSFEQFFKIPNWGVSVELCV